MGWTVRGLNPSRGEFSFQTGSASQLAYIQGVLYNFMTKSARDVVFNTQTI
jgi:hypothetical protein